MDLEVLIGGDQPGTNPVTLLKTSLHTMSLKFSIHNNNHTNNINIKKYVTVTTKNSKIFCPAVCFVLNGPKRTRRSYRGFANNHKIPQWLANCCGKSVAENLDKAAKLRQITNLDLESRWSTQSAVAVQMCKCVLSRGCQVMASICVTSVVCLDLLDWSSDL